MRSCVARSRHGAEVCASRKKVQRSSENGGLGVQGQRGRGDGGVQVKGIQQVSSDRSHPSVRVVWLPERRSKVVHVWGTIPGGREQQQQQQIHQACGFRARNQKKRKRRHGPMTSFYLSLLLCVALHPALSVHKGSFMKAHTRICTAILSPRGCAPSLTPPSVHVPHTISSPSSYACCPPGGPPSSISSTRRMVTSRRKPCLRR